MLFARILRSPHPHANILSIDTTRAEKLPGVKGVIHHRNTNVDANEALKPDAPKVSTNGNLSVGKGNFSAPILEEWVTWTNVLRKPIGFSRTLT